MRLIKYSLDPIVFLILSVVLLFGFSLVSQSSPARYQGVSDRTSSFTEVFGVRARACGSYNNKNSSMSFH